MRDREEGGRMHDVECCKHGDNVSVVDARKAGCQMSTSEPREEKKGGSMCSDVHSRKAMTEDDYNIHI